MIVRKADKQDMPQVLELIKELAVFEREPASVVEVTVSELEEAGFGENPQFICFVAEANQEIKGLALVYFRFSTWKGRTLYLEDLIVRESDRGKGIGMLLYKEVLKFAKKEKVKRVNWVVLDWNENAIQFYEKTGAEVLDDWRLVAMNKDSLEIFLNEDI